MSKIKNTPKNTDEVLVNEVRKAIEHRATWMGLILDNVDKENVDFEAIGRAAIDATGCMHGTAIKEKLSEPTMQEFQKTFINELGQRLFEMEIMACDDDKLEVEFHYCPLVTAWQKLGLSDERIEVLCDMAMDGDRAIAKANNLEFKLGKTIAQGYDVCEVNFYKK